ncbi:imidazole glycerol phosphate synthase subunit HisH [Ihubacter massiliensis]|uniref:Imidazole glycerol phosphate synthase subunit HisH n=1 Tax=Hominibacterium faecale TaxID=2839743 RepID=A0A9J6QUK3_9FIRM|nr:MULTISPECIES: imidazole glycerol phosphate synthase subunit HisH [Eubacteriales Family XIII. Incertae Sedis]MCO7123138.1 imidazole glycerol phosphate synthase subunit HisH [Ihubacter massiliensis]MCU7377398.1 imidazole glycerol phosphate synthase subunit HisH [Hominibacterium faecale]
MIAVIDYGVGNLFSLTASLKFLGAETVVTNQKEDIEAADRIILPGVGAFEDAIAKLKATGLVETIIRETEKGKPLLGICLGMQLLFEMSYEYGRHRGLGLIKGEIASIEEDLPKRPGGRLKVPHIGWNSLNLKCSDPLFKYIKEGDYVYYVHSFYGKNCLENTIASSNYDIEITGAVRSGSVYGTQFHPEKSGNVGLNILRAFIQL